jgi:hypothetical protein
VHNVFAHGRYRGWDIARTIEMAQIERRERA